MRRVGKKKTKAHPTKAHPKKFGASVLAIFKTKP
jgi:hypothetical protein